ncbi:MAG TPA: hypothetical protein VJG90_03115 [Candidatus Nanoarchaeia archaeon]|nr:hypothetical protein [Candidatus Nanoarchaeia archaeon]
MEKIQLEKNRLDLLFHKRLQEQNALLILATTGVLTFIGTFVWNRPDFKIGLLITLSIWIISAIWYFHTTKGMQDILNQLRNLK